MLRGEAGNRPLRIAAEIRRELPDILRDIITLPDGLLLSVLDVEVTSDLSQARVYFSLVGPHEQESAQKTERQLNGKKGLVRRAISQRMVMRQHPEFRFIYDDTPARAARIEQLLREVRDESHPPDDQGDA